MSKVDGTVLEDYQRSQKSRTYVGRRTITYITSISFCTNVTLILKHEGGFDHASCILHDVSCVR